MAKNNTAIHQPWCENLTINDILDENCDLKKNRRIPNRTKASFFFMKILLLKMQLENLYHNVNMSVEGHVRSVLGISGLQ